MRHFGMDAWRAGYTLCSFYHPIGPIALMDSLVVLLLLVVGLRLLNMRDQHERIALLGQHLGRYQIEKHMESLVQGYMRALGESDAQRQLSIWRLLASAEHDLCAQVSAFVLDFSKEDEARTRISKLPLALPFATRWWSSQCIDARKLLSLHAHALMQAEKDQPGQSPKQKAFTFMAELFLFQHSCHWFCRSRIVASARLLARHQTAYAQVLAAVAPPTREAYLALLT